MNLRNIPSGPFNLKEPWIIALLGCPLEFLIFKLINFSNWWNIFHRIGLLSLAIGFIFLFGKKIVNDKYLKNMNWVSGLFLNWFFATYIISQIARER